MAKAGVSLEAPVSHHDDDVDRMVSLLARSVGELAERCDVDAKLNFLLTNGRMLLASRWGNTLHWVAREGVHDCEICGHSACASSAWTWLPGCRGGLGADLARAMGTSEAGPGRRRRRQRPVHHSLHLRQTLAQLTVDKLLSLGRGLPERDDAEPGPDGHARRVEQHDLTPSRPSIEQEVGQVLQNPRQIGPAWATAEAASGRHRGDAYEKAGGG